jgi:hypothetical protein
MKFYMWQILIFKILYKKYCKLICHWSGHIYTAFCNNGIIFNDEVYPSIFYVCSRCNNSLSPEEYKQYERKQKIKTIL